MSSSNNPSPPAATFAGVAMAVIAMYRLRECRICGYHVAGHNSTANDDDDSAVPAGENESEDNFCILCGFCLLRPVAPKRAPPKRPQDAATVATTAAAPSASTAPPPPKRAPPARPTEGVPAVKSSPSPSASPPPTAVTSASAPLATASLLASIAALESDARARVASKLADVDAARSERERKDRARFAREEAQKRELALTADKIYRRQLSVEMDLAATRAAQQQAAQAQRVADQARVDAVKAAEAERTKQLQEEQARRLKQREAEEAEFRRRTAELEAAAEAQRQEAQRRATEAAAEQQRQAHAKQQADQEAAVAASAAAARAKAAEDEAQRKQQMQALLDAQRARQEAQAREDAQRAQQAQERLAAEEARAKADELARAKQAEAEARRLQDEHARLERERVALEIEAKKAKEAEAAALKLAEEEAERERVKQQAAEEVKAKQEATAAAATAKKLSDDQAIAVVLKSKATSPSLVAAAPAATAASLTPAATSTSTSSSHHSRTASLLSRFTTATHAAEDSVELKVRKRLDDAVRWVDTQVRRLIEVIEKLGGPLTAPGSTKVTFGALFLETEGFMEALAGTLMTAKKRKVLTYPGAILLQRVHDSIVITLLLNTIPDSPLPDHSKRDLPPLKAGGFTSSTNIIEKCAVCTKTVYPNERVGATGSVYHSECFRCYSCNKILEPTTFANVNHRNYCQTCFHANVNKSGLNF